ncbi:MAG: hypothetical protein ACRDHL_11500 [Candidatus Promineifilaceae bacterium]
MSDAITFSETAERLKVVIPARRNGLLIALTSVAMLVWLVMLGILGTALITRFALNLVLTTLVFLWLLIWLWFGRFLWRRLLDALADREILFIDADQLILRRPVSILGATAGYDRNFVSPFYFSAKHDCPAFDYAYQHVYFGHSLPPEKAKALVDELNGRYFPDADETPEEADATP